MLRDFYRYQIEPRPEVVRQLVEAMLVDGAFPLVIFGDGFSSLGLLSGIERALLGLQGSGSLSDGSERVDQLDAPDCG